LQTYNTNYQTPDSAGTASALFSGVKTTYKTMGFDSSVVYKSPASQMEARCADIQGSML
jgi:alkaline phosphatase